MATIQTLEKVSIEELLDTFNLSFSDYVIPFFLTKEQLENRLKGDGVRFDLSVGAFEGKQLIAFVLHGYGIIDNLKVAYNAGTGVVPAKRGNRLIAKLYEYALPIFFRNGISRVLLEVITKNERAVRTYANIGFVITRHFTCYKGSINMSSPTSYFGIRKLRDYDWLKLRSFWNFTPSWQNSSEAVEKLRMYNASIAVYENESLLGYAIYNPVTKRIHQLAVDKGYRKKGVGTCLLQYISVMYGEDISVINVDDCSEETLKFFSHIGLIVFVNQYEMALNLNVNI